LVLDIKAVLRLILDLVKGNLNTKTKIALQLNFFFPELYIENYLSEIERITILLHEKLFFWVTLLQKMYQCKIKQ